MGMVSRHAVASDNDEGDGEPTEDIIRKPPHIPRAEVVQAESMHRIYFHRLRCLRIINRISHFIRRL
mgnify:CR=1 FL=1